MSLDFFKSWRRYRQFKQLEPSQRAIVFYSEGGQDWHHLQPIVAHLTGELGRTVCYVSSDPGDAGLSQENDRILPFYVRRLPYWQRLHASALSRSIRGTVTLGDQRSTTCREWLSLLPGYDTMLGHESQG